MARVLKAKLNTSDIERLISELESYKDELISKCQEYVDTLAEIGITTARWNLYQVVNDTSGEMISIGDKVAFAKEMEVSDMGAATIIIPASQPFVNTWDTGVAVVDPLLMAEFGSGMFAVEGHRGTFPDQKYAFNPQGWYWKKDGVTHHSYGIEPTRPLFKAYEEMKSQMQAVAAQVFGA